jgi:hypothetical protein
MSNEDDSREYQPRFLDKTVMIKYTGQKIVISKALPTRNPPDIGTDHLCIEKPDNVVTTYNQAGEVWIWHNSEAARIFQEEYHTLGDVLVSDPFEHQYQVDLEKQCQEKCAIGIDEDFEFADGWIDCDGHFHAIASMQHEANIDDLRERLNKQELTWFFQNWVKISLSMWSGLHIFSSEQYSRTKLEKAISVTARQKLTIEKYLEARPNLLQEGKTMDFMGYGSLSGKITRENGKIKFIAGRRNADLE